MFSIRNGCHCVFLMVIICSVITIVLFNDGTKGLDSDIQDDVSYVGTTVAGINILSAFIFLYSYMRKKILFSSITFLCWLLLVGFFHIIIFLTPKTLNDNKFKIILTIHGFLYIYFGWIVKSYFQGFHLINQQKLVEQVEAFDELEIMESQGGFSFGYAFPFVHLSYHLQNHREAVLMDRVGGGRRGRW